MVDIEDILLPDITHALLRAVVVLLRAVANPLWIALLILSVVIAAISSVTTIVISSVATTVIGMTMVLVVVLKECNRRDIGCHSQEPDLEGVKILAQHTADLERHLLEQLEDVHLVLQTNRMFDLNHTRTRVLNQRHGPHDFLQERGQILALRVNAFGATVGGNRSTAEGQAEDAGMARTTQRNHCSNPGKVQVSLNYRIMYE
mmetsp:Transcript_130769/g.419412  ORF Transcript_130769/g.419412 Transcript_130769/m.419412 type:complete len:203 (-) Transcript_130769:28-636(-)